MLDEFCRYRRKTLSHKKGLAEDIHRLRTKARELLSLMEPDDPAYDKLKGVIKRSNKIRDIDIFFDYYMESLPKRHVKKIDLSALKERILKKRAKELEMFYAYLKSLNMPKQIYIPITQSRQTGPRIDPDSITTPYQKELHKYRIFIKEELYKAKNSSLIKKKKIKMLTRIKDTLGYIHDNINGFEMLKSFCKKEKLLEKIDKFTHKSNMKLFEKFKELDIKCREKKYIS